MLLPADLTFRREEVSDLLKLNPSVIDALVASGALNAGTIAAADLERLFRDSLLRLYQAQAMRSAAPAPVVTWEPERELEMELEMEIEARPDTEAPVAETLATPAEGAEEEQGIVRTYEEVMDIDERPNLRAGVRYVPRRQIGGVFRDVKFVMVQLSSSGLRIRHDEALRPGDEARLSFAILNPPKSFVMRARVVWTSIAQHGDERSFYISGLRVVENADRLVNAAYLLRTARELQIDDRDIGRRVPNTRSTPRNMPRHVTGLSDEDVVKIIQAVRKLADDPQEASRWYARARFAIADEEVRKAAPRGAREREEVVGVWEYLQRQPDLKTVAGVMQWIRNSHVAAV
jgi:hypothetical protein